MSWSNRELRWLVSIALFGLILRFVYIGLTKTEPPHPDLGSFLAPALSMNHPFDTSFREPLFVWWLWGLSKIGLSSPLAIRYATACWFFPTALCLFYFAAKFLSRPFCWGVLFLYMLLPSQIHADALGMRHTLEAFGVMSVMLSFGFLPQAASAAGLVLTRITFMGSVFLLLAERVFRTKQWTALLALGPACLLLLFHLHHNRVQFQDPFYSINLHTYWFVNLENIGKPGYAATMEEWQKDPYKKSLKFSQWAWEQHGLGKFFQETAVGTFRCLWIFYQKVYFAEKLPWPVTWLLLGFYVWGFLAAAWQKNLRVLPLALVFLVLPVAFVSHVFWAGRFFLPLTPLVLIVMGAGVQSVWIHLPKERRSPK